jgi:RES domain-containing protein
LNERLLDDGHVWLRITKPHYAAPLDPRHAQQHGGRWNKPGSWPTLYLNHDLRTVHAQVRHLIVDRGIDVDDLDDDAPILLVAATLPARQRVADLTSDKALADAGLPTSYPIPIDANPIDAKDAKDAKGRTVSPDATRNVGERVHDAGLRGVFCRSAAIADGTGRELAWFPSARGRARPVWRHPLGFGQWRRARTVADIPAS